MPPCCPQTIPAPPHMSLQTARFIPNGTRHSKRHTSLQTAHVTPNGTRHFKRHTSLQTAHVIPNGVRHSRRHTSLHNGMHGKWHSAECQIKPKSYRGDYTNRVPSHSACAIAPVLERQSSLDFVLGDDSIRLSGHKSTQCTATDPQDYQGAEVQHSNQRKWFQKIRMTPHKSILTGLR